MQEGLSSIEGFPAFFDESRKTMGSTTSQAFLQGVPNLMNVEWSRTYLWDIQFLGGEDSTLNPAPPAPFDKWFPAIDFQEVAATVNTTYHGFYINNYKFASTGNNIDITLTVHDDVYGTLYHWLLDWWHNTVLDTDGVAMLEDCYRQLLVVKLDASKQILKTYIYYVIPENTIVEVLNSHSDTKAYSIQFAVIGKEDPQVSSQSGYYSELSNTDSNTANQTAPTFTSTNF